MRRLIGTSSVGLLALVLCAAGMSPSLARGQPRRAPAAPAGPAAAAPAPPAPPTAADSQTWARQAQQQARAARALARNALVTFGPVAEAAAPHIEAALGASRIAAEAAADHALVAADIALQLANEAAAAQPEDPVLTANALAAARSAQAAAQRGDAAAKAAVAAYSREKARAASAASDAASFATAAATAATQAKASLDAIADLDNQAAAQFQRVVDVGVEAIQVEDVRARTGQAAAQLGFATFHAGQVPTLPATPPAPPGRLFNIDGPTPVSLTITYNLRSKLHDFDVENGTLTAGTLAFVATDGYRPPRITVTLTFIYEQNGYFTIPRSAPLRFVLDNTGKYKCSAEDTARIASDFVRIMNANDRTFSPVHVIPAADVSIQIFDENTNQVDQIQGGLRFVPRLISLQN
jgi:hypothetical protein